MGDAALDEQALVTAFGKDVVLLLGREDIDHNDPSLRNSPEAKRQGPNRFARGHAMYDAAESKAKEVGADFNWKLVIVDDAGHVNAEMARVASLLVE
jgi:hypothetical protein